MKPSMQSQNMLNRLLVRTGGWYVIFAIVLTQLAASASLVLGIIFEQLNAEYSLEIISLIRNINYIGIPIAILVILSAAFFISRKIRARLNIWKNDPELFNNQENSIAWKDTHSITWKYAVTSAVIFFSCIIAPKSGMLFYSELASWDQFIYSLISGAITSLAFIPLSSALLDRLLIPVREVLLPGTFEQQLEGKGGLKLLYKNQAMMFISLMITALLIAPIGYHQTTKVLYEAIGSQEVLSNLQIQSIMMSVFAIIFASSLSFLITRSISDPLGQLLKTFQKVESGDLTTRTPVISSDETGELAIYFNRMIARLQELQSNLEEKVQERTAQLQAINAVGRAATSVLDPEELISRIVNLITEEFGYYFSAIYLLDKSGQWAELKEATGDAGKTLKEVKYRVEVGATNIIGHAIQSRQAKVALDTGNNPVKFENPLLPYTRSEISLPLYVGNQVLGALDVQATQEAAFSEEDVETFQNMANQVAISLDNARLFQETRQNLNEMRNIQKQYLQTAWIDSNLPQGGISLAIGESSDGNEKTITEVPIALRDQIIGQLSLEGGEPLSQEEESWVQAIATQAALALENARLIEESQGTAMREKFVTEINNKIWTSTTIDGVLQTAIRELGQILDATEATIEINVDGE